MAILPCVQHSYQAFIISKNLPIIYLACSGGRDSMALLFACHQLNLPIHVIHINHKIQSVSDDWQNLVEQFCQKYQVPYHSLSLTWQQPLNSINEQHARTARYQAMINWIISQQSNEKPIVIATAHHADDQAETILMNLCQGTGLAGLTGMAEMSEQSEFSQFNQNKSVWLWRPLLPIKREQINQFVADFALPYVDDPTNFGQKNQRAFLREQVLPLLNQRFNHVIDNINRTQRNIAEAKTIIDEEAQGDLATCQIYANSYQQILAIDRLQVLNQARRFNLFHHWVKGEQKFAPLRQFIEQIDGLITSQNPDQQAILAWQGVQIRRYRQTLYRLSPPYVALLTNPALFTIQFKQSLQDFFAHSYPTLMLRAVLPNEKFQRAGQDFHESFKKICQRYAIPSWERDFVQVLINEADKKLALFLPKQLLWLADSEDLSRHERQKLTKIFANVITHATSGYDTL